MSSPADAAALAAGSAALQDLIGEAMIFHRGAARKHGLTLLQLLLLRSLEVKGPLSPSQLATLFGISRPAITSSINTLEEGGWVVRSHPAGDRRALRTSLTHQALGVLQRVTSERQHFLEQGLAGVAPSERAAFARTARRLVDRLRELHPSELAADGAARAS
ncbi:MAG: MarR family transcriptional regulator [Thermoplasmata archaeon]|nr:MarR family transcriptional regulator [Thermoplasmata archaeon]